MMAAAGGLTCNILRPIRCVAATPAAPSIAKPPGGSPLNQKAGLEPAGTQGYLQPVKLISRRVLQDQSTLALVRNGKAEPMVIGEDAIISARGEPADSTEAPAVFVGYGLAIPEQHYDDLAGLDLKGKLAVVLLQGPPNVPSNLSSHYQSNAERWKRLKAAGAIGIVSVLNPRHMDLPWDRITLARFQPAMMLADPALQDTAGMRLSVLFNPERTEKLFAGSGHTFQELLAAADAGKALPHFALPGSVRATVRSERKELESTTGPWTTLPAWLPCSMSPPPCMTRTRSSSDRCCSSP